MGLWTMGHALCHYVFNTCILSVVSNLVCSGELFEYPSWLDLGWIWQSNKHSQIYMKLLPTTQTPATNNHASTATPLLCNFETWFLYYLS